jgi:Tol biopolymer transport system component
LDDVVANLGSWSPEGKEIIWEYHSDIFVMNGDGTGSKRLLVARRSDGTWIWNPFWSPDGKLIGFTTGLMDRFDREIWESSADGANPHPLLPGWEKPPTQCCGAWSPDGKYFVFASKRGTGGDQLWARREATGLFRKSGEPVPVDLGIGQCLEPTIQPGGDKIFAIGTDFRTELTRLDSRSQRLVPYLGGISVAGLRFSRDGQWMAFSKVPQDGLWRYRVNGGEQLSLIERPMRLGDPDFPPDPQWSPDGKLIAFTGEMPGTPPRIYTVATDGATAPREVLSKGPCCLPSWSPDGPSLIFNCNGSSFEPEIYTYDLRSSQLSAVPESTNLKGPSFSPDGRFVVAHDEWKQTPNTRNRLSLFDVGQRAWRTLATIKSPGHTAWSGDGRCVYFVAEGTEESIYRLRIADRKLERLGAVENVSNGEPERWFTLAPDDSPLTLRNTGFGEILALDWEAP